MFPALHLPFSSQSLSGFHLHLSVDTTLDNVVLHHFYLTKSSGQFSIHIHLTS